MNICCVFPHFRTLSNMKCDAETPYSFGSSSVLRISTNPLHFACFPLNMQHMDNQPYKTILCASIFKIIYIEEPLK